MVHFDTPPGNNSRELYNFISGLNDSVNRVRSYTTTPQTLVAADDRDKWVVLDRAAGITVTLPAATGSGDTYKFFVKTATSGGSQIVKVANASNTMLGRAVVSQDAADTVVEFEAGATADTITLNGTTTGGGAGSTIEVVDILANLWHVNVRSLAGSGVEATPFSATV